MEQKRILLLGGAYAQIPMIEEAKKQGFYTITCDYLPNNPGHKIADEYHNVSTTDYNKILQLAVKVKPDLIIAYASDPAAPIAAYVSEKLGLAGNSFESVKLLAEKDLFRKLLKKLNLRCPLNITIEKNEIADCNNIIFPVIVKPVDSSGSKGVTKVCSPNEMDRAVEYAMQFSRAKKVIIEEFIDNEEADIHGDGFVSDGKLVFSCLGDHIYNKNSNQFNPCGTIWPTQQSEKVVNEINRLVGTIIRETGFKTGSINIEARINKNGELFIMEIGPRSGGHFVPQAINYATEFNMVKATIDSLQNKGIIIPTGSINPTAYYALHSDINSVLKNISFSSDIEKNILEFHQYIQPGEAVKPFHGANAAIGVLLLTAKTNKELLALIKNIKKHISIKF
ncbi:ATP-grasp domain-containing protein [Marinilabiliaceae bacterium ANBcel2]|nr:ATP-grasp domain-containing protein [Marinilabiliaceae bacterium ANBcel2]